MIQIYYEDGSSQVIRPTHHFDRSGRAIQDLVRDIAKAHPVKYYLTQF
jgi:hypothetical protein